MLWNRAASWYGSKQNCVCVFLLFFFCICVYVLSNLPGLEHKSKSLIREKSSSPLHRLQTQNKHKWKRALTDAETDMWAHIYIHTYTNTHTRGRMGAGQADWNYHARPWALSSNFQRKQILDATVIFPFNTDQESSWHICSLPMSPFASDLCACPALLFFYRVNSEGDTQHSDSKIKKKRDTKKLLSFLSSSGFQPQQGFVHM